MEAERHRIRTKVLWTVPWFAVDKIVAAAELGPGDSVMELGVTDGDLLLAAASMQVGPSQSARRCCRSFECCR